MGLKWMKACLAVTSPSMFENASFCFICSCTCIKIELNQWSCCLPSELSSNCIQKQNQDSFPTPHYYIFWKAVLNFLPLAARNKCWFPIKINLRSIYIHLCQSYFWTRIGFSVSSLTYLSKADLYQPIFLASTGCISFALSWNCIYET